MDKIFLHFLPLSVKACVIIPLIIAVRFIIRKQPKIYSYRLWAVVFVSLVFNFEINTATFSPAHKINRNITQQYNSLLDDYVEETEIHHSNTMQYYEAVEKGIVPEIADDGKSAYVVTAQGSYTPPATVKSSIIPKLAILWAAGILAIAFYLLKNLLNFNAKLIYIQKISDEIYAAEGVSSPFVYGILKPKIIVPAEMADTLPQQIVLHEKIHIKRKDYLIKPAALAIAVVHWFNPFVWLAFRLMCRDMEMSCDEAVINRCGNKKDYSLQLLECAVEKASPATVMFGENNAESRIKNILAYRKPAKMISLLLCAVVAICTTACMVSEKAEEIIQDIPKTFYEQLADVNSTENVKYKDRVVADWVRKADLEEYGIEAPDTLPDTFYGLPYEFCKGYKYQKDGKTTFSYAYLPDYREANSICVHNCNDTTSTHLGIFLPPNETFVSLVSGLEVLDDRFSTVSYLTQDRNGDVWLNIRKLYFFNPVSEADTIRHKLDKENYVKIRSLRFLNENVAFMSQTEKGFIKEGSEKSSYTMFETPQANISIDGGVTWHKLDFSQLALPQYFTGYRSCCMTLTGDRVEIRFFTDEIYDADVAFTSFANETYYIISEDGGLTWTGWVRVWGEDGKPTLQKITDTVPVTVIE